MLNLTSPTINDHMGLQEPMDGVESAFGDGRGVNMLNDQCPMSKAVSYQRSAVGVGTARRAPTRGVISVGASCQEGCLWWRQHIFLPSRGSGS